VLFWLLTRGTASPAVLVCTAISERFCDHTVITSVTGGHTKRAMALRIAPLGIVRTDVPAWSIAAL
jgi:hypothetical protein